MPIATATTVVNTVTSVSASKKRARRCGRVPWVSLAAGNPGVRPMKKNTVAAAADAVHAVQAMGRVGV